MMGVSKGPVLYPDILKLLGYLVDLKWLPVYNYIDFIFLSSALCWHYVADILCAVQV